MNLFNPERKLSAVENEVSTRSEKDLEEKRNNLFIRAHNVLADITLSEKNIPEPTTPYRGNDMLLDKLIHEQQHVIEGIFESTINFDEAIELRKKYSTSLREKYNFPDDVSGVAPGTENEDKVRFHGKLDIKMNESAMRLLSLRARSYEQTMLLPLVNLEWLRVQKLADTNDRDRAENDIILESFKAKLHGLIAKLETQMALNAQKGIEKLGEDVAIGIKKMISEARLTSNNISRTFK